MTSKRKNVSSVTSPEAIGIQQDLLAEEQEWNGKPHALSEEFMMVASAKAESLNVLDFGRGFLHILETVVGVLPGSSQDGFELICLGEKSWRDVIFNENGDPYVETGDPANPAPSYVLELLDGDAGDDYGVGLFEEMATTRMKPDRFLDFLICDFTIGRATREEEADFGGAMDDAEDFAKDKASGELFVFSLGEVNPEAAVRIGYRIYALWYIHAHPAALYEAYVKKKALWYTEEKTDEQDTAGCYLGLCHNPSDVATLEAWRGHLLNDVVFVEHEDNRQVVRYHCLSRASIAHALHEKLFSDWVLNPGASGLDSTGRYFGAVVESDGMTADGHRGMPGSKKLVRLNLGDTFVYLQGAERMLGMLRRATPLLRLTADKEARIGNRRGEFGVGSAHGQHRHMLYSVQRLPLSYLRAQKTRGCTARDEAVKLARAETAAGERSRAVAAELRYSADVNFLVNNLLQAAYPDEEHEERKPEVQKVVESLFKPGDDKLEKLHEARARFPRKPTREISVLSPLVLSAGGGRTMTLERILHPSEKQSPSRSVVGFGLLDYQEVAIKVSFHTADANDTLANERRVYREFVQEALVYTPHLVKWIGTFEVPFWMRNPHLSGVEERLETEVDALRSIGLPGTEIDYNWRFFLMTELVSSRTLDVLAEVPRRTDWSHVFLQLAFTCAVFEQMNFLHNDLNLSNIFLETMEEPVELSYRLAEGEHYTIKTNYFVKVFGFERSSRLGNNAQPHHDWVTLGASISRLFKRENSRRKLPVFWNDVGPIGFIRASYARLREENPSGRVYFLRFNAGKQETDPPKDLDFGGPYSFCENTSGREDALHTPRIYLGNGALVALGSREARVRVRELREHPFFSFAELVPAQDPPEPRPLRGEEAMQWLLLFWNVMRNVAHRNTGLCASDFETNLLPTVNLDSVSGVELAAVDDRVSRWMEGAMACDHYLPSSKGPVTRRRLVLPVVAQWEGDDHHVFVYTDDESYGVYCHDGPVSKTHAERLWSVLIVLKSLEAEGFLPGNVYEPSPEGIGFWMLTDLILNPTQSLKAVHDRILAHDDYLGVARRLFPTARSMVTGNGFDTVCATPGARQAPPQNRFTPLTTLW